MKMNLYHGSKDKISQPVYGRGKKYNDYGQGFYCTDSQEMAMEWGVGLNHDGYANHYELDCSGLQILNLNDSPYCMLHWLSILLEHRIFDGGSPLAIEAKEYLLGHFSVDAASYDVIIGYRADDSYFSFAQDFISGTISYRQLCNAMRLGKLGQQIVLESETAFSQLTFQDCELAGCDQWYQKKLLRDQTARRTYFDVERNKRQRGDLYIVQIMDEEMTADDSRLR